MKKKMLILGAGNAQIDVIEYCRDRGFEVHGLSYTDTDNGISLLDKFEQINITDVNAVKEYAIRNKIDFIYSVGSDIAMPTVNEVAEALNLPHFVLPDTAKRCNNKHLMRETMGSGSRFNLPHILCKNEDEAKAAAVYPLVMKPVDSQGQRGVYLVNNFEELKLRFVDTLSYSKIGQIILEKYVCGSEVSVNAYVKNKRVIFSMLSDRESFENLPGGIIKAHHLPSVFEGSATHDDINALVREAVLKLEIENGPVYFQIKIENGRPYLIEVAPRLDGCHMWRLIKNYCGVDLLDITMTHLLGGEIEIPKYKTHKSSMHLEFFSEPTGGKVDAEKYEGYTADYKRMYYKNGDTVKKMNGYMEKCGYRIFKSPHRIALIGGSGFVGSNFIRLYGGKADVKNISRKSGEITEYSAAQLKKAMYGCDSAVILAAKKVNPKEKQSLALYEENTSIVENTLEACKSLGIRNIVYASSRCVYDNSQKSPVSEEGKINPINYYGISKYTGELLCEYYNRNFGFNIKILRLSQVIGKDENGYAIDTFMKSAMANLPINIFGKGAGRRDYIYIKDAADAIWRALVNYERHGVYNIGSGSGTTTVQLAQAVVKGFHSDSEIRLMPEKTEDTSVTYLDVSKAKKEFGFSCKYSIDNMFGDLRSESE